MVSTFATLGLQGAMGLGTGHPGVVACAKHFAGDGQATADTSSKGGVVDRIGDPGITRFSGGARAHVLTLVDL